MKKSLKQGFSLLEIMVALLVVSIILAVSAPMITSSAAKKAETVQVQSVTRVIDSTPIGAIVGWPGQNIPDGWLPLDGRQIDPRYTELKEVLGGAENLPNYTLLSSLAAQEQLREFFPESGYNEDSSSQSGSINLIWIIKAEHKR